MWNLYVTSLPSCLAFKFVTLLTRFNGNNFEILLSSSPNFYLLSPLPSPNFLSFFPPLGLCMWEEFFLSHFSASSCCTFYFLALFFSPAKYVCLVIQLLSVSHVLLLFLIPDHLFICHQVHHVLLAEHLQLLDSFSSENAGCYHHWYNWSELRLWSVIRCFFYDRTYKRNK